MYDIGIPEINVTARSESDDGRGVPRLCFLA